MYPENLKYSKEHEWVKVDGSTATIGITSHAQSELGDIVYVELPKVGVKFGAMKEFGVVESIKTVSTLYCPVSGEVLEVNSSLSSKPEAVNNDPYGQGWIIKIKLSNPSEVDKLLSATEYEALLKK
ncbi:MAG: glycine cleavage system protein GcvH [bacterium]